MVKLGRLVGSMRVRANKQDQRTVMAPSNATDMPVASLPILPLKTTSVLKQPAKSKAASQPTVTAFNLNNTETTASSSQVSQSRPPEQQPDQQPADQLSTLSNGSQLQAQKQASQLQNKHQEQPPDQKDEKTDDEKKAEKLVQKIEEQKKQNPGQPIVVTKEGDDKIPRPVSEVSQEVMRLKGFWPFDLVPDELIIETKRIVINRRYFPWMKAVITMYIKDIKDCEVTFSLLFASLYLKSEVETTVAWLKHSDASRAKEMIDGLVLKEKTEMTMAEEGIERQADAFSQLGDIGTLA